MNRSVAGLTAATVIAALALAGSASAGNGAKQKSVTGSAKDAVTSPLQDLNLAGDHIPTELLLLRKAPYSTEGLDSCEPIDRQIATLEHILGPDVDLPKQGGGVLRSALKAGGGFLSGFIPFRGVLREVTGANERKQRMEDAVYAGVARRSFLKGVAAAKGCPTAEQRAIATARQGLGME